MDFKFEPVPLVQQKKKYANFTIKEIGGPAEIIEWRRQQKAKEAVYNFTLSQRDQRIRDHESKLGHKLDTPQVKGASWDEKLDFALSERKRLAKLEDNVIQFPPWEPIQTPKPTLMQRLKRFWMKLWDNPIL